MKRSFLYAAMVLAVVATSAWADWTPGDPYKMHYPQLPDLTSTGLDVLDTHDAITGQWKVLADDFRCTRTGPISDVHIWGSWLNNQVSPDPTFKLSIHDNIASYPSMPADPPLWVGIFSPGHYSSRLYSSGPTEGFYNPNIGQIVGYDNAVFQYNFTNILNPFIQQEGHIYWLDVQVLVPQGYQFGWKTTNPAVTQHFMDDAVYADTSGFAGPRITPYNPLVYPAGHPYAGLSMDLAFVITPEPATLSLLALGGLALLRRRR